MLWQLHKLHRAVGILPVPNSQIILRERCQINVPHYVPVASVNVARKEKFPYLLAPGYCPGCFCKYVLLLIPPWRVGFIPVCEGMIWVQ